MDIYSKIIEVVETEDCESAIDILEELALTAQTFPFQQPNQMALVSTMLLTAAHQEELGICFARALIEGAARLIDLHIFLRNIIYVSGIRLEDIDIDSSIDCMPEIISETLYNCEPYDERIANAIEELDENAFEALIFFIIGGVKSVDAEYNTSIIWHIYDLEIVPDETLFSMMGCFIKSDNIFDAYIKELLDGGIGSVTITVIPLDINSQNSGPASATDDAAT